MNTNGLSSLYNKRDITPEFKGLLDTVSISLNTSNKERLFKNLQEANMELIHLMNY